MNIKISRIIAGILVLAIGLYFLSSSFLLIYHLVSKKEPSSFLKGYFELLLFRQRPPLSFTWDQVKSTPIQSLLVYSGFGLLGIIVAFFGLFAILPMEWGIKIGNRIRRLIGQSKGEK